MPGKSVADKIVPILTVRTRCSSQIQRLKKAVVLLPLSHMEPRKDMKRAGGEPPESDGGQVAIGGRRDHFLFDLGFLFFWVR